MSTVNTTIVNFLHRAPKDDMRRVSYSLLAASQSRRRKKPTRSRLQRFWSKFLG